MAYRTEKVWLVTHRTFKIHAKTSILGVYASKHMAENAIFAEQVGRVWTWSMHWTITELGLNQRQPFSFEKE